MILNRFLKLYDTSTKHIHGLVFILNLCVSILLYTYRALKTKAFIISTKQYKNYDFENYILVVVVLV